MFVDCSGTHGLLKSPKDRNPVDSNLVNAVTILECDISADQWTCKVTIQPFHSDVSCMGSCTILLEPLLFLMHAMMGTECPPELVENQDVMLFINCHCLTNNFLKPKWSDYDKFRYGNTGSALYRVQWSLKDFIWCLRSPKHRFLAVDMA